MSDEIGLSPVEAVKDKSNYLFGTISEDLAKDTPQFAKENAQLLKFHGTYQQDDRETRTSTGEGKSLKEISFMVRSRIPGGKLTAAQLLAHLDLCDEIGNATLKITTRQGLQLHGILKSNLRKCIHRINEIHLSTLAACGDVNRNVMCCPAPYTDPVHIALQKLADDLAHHLAPRTRAYYELWVKDPDSGESVLAGGGDPNEEVEPIYGKHYLPRKFKTAIGLPEDNCVDIYTNDLGFLAVVRDGQVVGYNVLVGGGLGVTPANKKTFPALAKRMAYCTAEQAVAVAEAVVKAQRDHGNRADRKTARLKYVIASKGVEWFREKVEGHLGYKLPDCTPDDVHGFDDHIGWFEQGDGRWFYGLNVENGRLFDNEDRRWKHAFRDICEKLNPGIRLTAHQSILFTDLTAEQKPLLESIIRNHGIPLSEDISEVRRWSMACVALPTCSLAITESERVLPSVMDQLEKEVARHGLSSERFTVRMTGCPNGCARPYNADVGLVGKAKGRYTVYLGGALLGTRLGTIYKDLVPLEQITATLSPLLVAFKKHRLSSSESFGDFCHRAGKEQLEKWSEEYVSI
jgi:sulfite reductase (ferredoxin)